MSQFVTEDGQAVIPIVGTDGNQFYITAESIPTDEASTFRWQFSATKLLIKLVKENYESLNSNKMTKRQVWTQIAAKMLLLGEHQVTWEQCNTKWKTLRATYTNLLEKRNKTGRSRETWEYFDDINEFLEDECEVKKPISSYSFGAGFKRRYGVVERRGGVAEEAEIDSDDAAPPTSSRFSSIKRAQRTDRRMEKSAEARAEMRHRENLDRKDKFLELLEKLIEKI